MNFLTFTLLAVHRLNLLRPRVSGGQVGSAAVAGVGRRPLAVAFGGAPAVEVVDKPVGVEVGARAEQVYLAPVLETVGGQAAAGALPLEAGRWRRRVDAAQR